jgi:hypothetical protein
MKKLIMLSAALVLLSAAAFADLAATWGLQAYSGLIVWNNGDTTDMTSGSYSNWGHSRLRLTGVIEDANVSGHFRIQNADAGQSNVDYAYGQIKFGDKVVSKFGKVDDGAWNSLGPGLQTMDEGESDVGEGWGVLTQYVGTPNLNVGFGVYTPKGPATSYVDYFGNPPVPVDHVGDADITFGAAYTVPGLLKFAGSGKIATITDNNEVKRHKFNSLFASVQLLSIKNVNLVVEGVSPNLGFEDKAWQFSERVGVQLGKLNLTLTVYEGLGTRVDNEDVGNWAGSDYASFSSAGHKDATAFMVVPSAFYWVSPKFSLLADAGFEIMNDKFGGSYLQNTATKAESNNYFYVRPMVMFTPGKGIIVVGYKLAKDSWEGGFNLGEVRHKAWIDFMINL